MTARTVHVFLTVEEPLRREREAVLAAIQTVQRELADAIVLTPVDIERTAAAEILAMREAAYRNDLPDVVIAVVSARLGAGRPHFASDEAAPDETRHGHEDTLKLSAKGTTPALLLYRKAGNGIAIRSEISASLKQKKAFNDFVDVWFGGAEDSFEAEFGSFLMPEELERRTVDDLRRIMRRHLPGGAGEKAETAGFATWTLGSPFPGMVPYGSDRNEVFFGRQRAIRELNKSLIERAGQGRAFVLLSGMSGCGKTSLVQAGIVPSLTEPGVVDGVDVWRWCRFEPAVTQNEDIFASLAGRILADDVLPELADGGVSRSELADLLREAPKRADIPLRMALRRVGEKTGGTAGSARLLLFVDQLERLFSLGLNRDDQRRFFDVLMALAQSSQVWIIAALRSDRLADCRQFDVLAEVIDRGGEYRLSPPTFAEYGQIIRGPARAAGLQFETDPESGERLDDILHQAAIADPGSLPLLQHTVQALHARIRSDDRVLTFNAYRRLGGLEGIIARLAEEVFGSLEQQYQSALPALLRALVTVAVEDSGRPEARSALMSDLRLTPERSRLLDAFVAANLVNVGEDSHGRPVARLANQAMLPHWPRVREWLREDQSFLRARATLINAARYWRQQSRNPDFLLSEGQSLAEHERLPEEWREYLDAEAIEYVEASIAVATERRAKQSSEEQRRHSRLTWIVAVLVGVVAAASAIGGYLSYHLYLRIGE